MKIIRPAENLRHGKLRLPIADAAAFLAVHYGKNKRTGLVFAIEMPPDWANQGVFVRSNVINRTIEIFLWARGTESGIQPARRGRSVPGSPVLSGAAQS